MWLKDNVLKDYQALEGVSAADVVLNNKYLCLSGSIVYTLIAQEAGLNVKGVMVPGHAYALLDLDRRRIVETTADGASGFDLKTDRDISGKFREPDRALYKPAFDGYQEISDPMKFVAYQYANVAASRIESLVSSAKYERLCKQALAGILRIVAGVNSEVQPDTIQRLRRNGIVVFESPEGPQKISAGSEGLSMIMAQSNNEFRQDLIGDLNKNVETLKVARRLSPFDEVLRDQMDMWILRAARCEYAGALAAMIARETRMYELQQSIKSEDTTQSARDEAKGELKSLKDPLTQQRLWTREKYYWLRGLKRLSAAAEQYPCDDRLRAARDIQYNLVMKLAQANRDEKFADDLSKHGIAALP